MTNNATDLYDFLLYDVWGGIMFNIPFVALSGYIGWKVTQAIFKKSKLGKRVIVGISVLVSIGIFVVLKSLSNNG
ncbi:MAG: hypothetical protein ACD_81C00058G0003 [uncultured bacterium]|nr:MAG: hypothetical protein ACD_81C00058G0003 [uncultured bacterium]